MNKNKNKLQDTRCLIQKSNVRDTWQTPSYVFDYFNKMINFEIDLAASKENALCKKFFTEQDDALADHNNWDDVIAWCNPPYSMNKQFLAKAASANRSIIVFLVPNSTDTRWFHDALRAKVGFYLIEGRVQFNAPLDLKKSSNPNGSIVIVFDSRKNKYNGFLGTINLKDMKNE